MFNTILASVLAYKYLVLFIIAFLEGPVTSLAVGFGVHTGTLALWPAYGVLILGDLVPDVLYYSIGRFGNKHQLLTRYEGKIPVVKNFSLVEKLWTNHPRKTMFFSKLAYGLSTPFLISAGLANMPFKKFVSLTIPITVIEYGSLMAIGYALGNSYALAEKYVKSGAEVIAVLVIILITTYVIFSRYAKKEIAKIENNPS